LKTFVTMVTGLYLALAVSSVGVRAQVTIHPLVLTNPPSSGAPDTSMPVTHPLLFAAVGIEYQRQIVAVHGDIMGNKTYALSGDVPSGMVIENAGASETCGQSYATATTTYTHVDCGRISGWTPSSAADNHTITVTVTDASSDSVNASWTINAIDTGVGSETIDIVVVDGDDGTYRSGNGSAYGAANCASGCGTGTLANPWKTIEDAFEGTHTANGGAAGSIVYFRHTTTDGGGGTGTYTVPFATGIVSNTSDCDPISSTSIAWSANGRASSMVGFPGEDRPVIDLRFDGSFTAEASCTETNAPPLFQVVGNGMVDRMHFKNGHVMFLQVQATSEYWMPTITNNVFDTIGPPGFSESNTSGVMVSTVPGATQCTDTGSRIQFGGAFANNQFVNMSTGSFKFYSLCYAWIANNSNEGNLVENNDGDIALKGGVSFYNEVAHNVGIDIDAVCIGGNNAGWVNTVIHHNLCVTVTAPTASAGYANKCVMWGQNWDISEQLNPTWIIYNSCDKGRIWLRGSSTDTTANGNTNIADEEVYIYGNALENGDAAQTPSAGVCIGAGTPTSPSEFAQCVITGDEITLALLNISNNLVAASGVLNADGELEDEGDLGTYGFQWAEEGAPEPPAGGGRPRIRGFGRRVLLDLPRFDVATVTP
jgi:hypothetical protein